MSESEVAGRTRAIVLLGGSVVLLLTAYVTRLRGEDLDTWDLATIGLLILAMFVGELLRLGGPSGRGIAPVATAAAVALALTSQVGEHAVTYGAPAVIVVVALTLLVSATWTERRDRMGLRVAGHAIRIFVVAFLAIVFRELPLADGESLSAAAAHNELEPRLLTAILVALAVVALAIELLLHVWLRTGLMQRPWRLVLREDLTEMVPIAAASMLTGVVVAIGMRSLSLTAIVLFLIPLVLMRFAIDRRQGARLARRQTITALSRLTDLAGYTTDGHAERVADLCARVAVSLGLREADLVDIEAAALLHDIGQVAMHQPVPHGATVDLAPLDQQRIADDSADLIGQTGSLDASAAIVRAYPTSYRVLHSEGLPLPLGARILKVCNAYDDLTGGDSSCREAALERITLGLGYEYDPEVVALVTAVTQESAAPPGSSRAEGRSDVY